MTLSLFLNKYLYGVDALYLPKAKENSCWRQKFLSLCPELKGTLGGIVPSKGFLWRISEEGTRPHVGKCCLLLWDPGFVAVYCNYCHNPGGFSCSPVKPSHSPCGYQGNRTENLFLSRNQSHLIRKIRLSWPQFSRMLYKPYGFWGEKSEQLHTKFEFAYRLELLCKCIPKHSSLYMEDLLALGNLAGIPKDAIKCVFCCFFWLCLVTSIWSLWIQIYS